MVSERCDRCGRFMSPADYDAEHVTLHASASGRTGGPFDLGDGTTLPAGSFYHGNSWKLLCPECSADWRQWFALFMGEGERIAMYGRGDGGDE